MPGATGMATETLHETALQRARREFTPVSSTCRALSARRSGPRSLPERRFTCRKATASVRRCSSESAFSSEPSPCRRRRCLDGFGQRHRRGSATRPEPNSLAPKKDFPGARISVKDIGYFDKDGERLLLFAVKVTNRELTQRMNLEFDFYLRVLATISKLSPGLKPLDMRLRRAEHPKANPPDPLIVDAQDSSPELNYLVKSDEFADALDFDDGGHGFRPKSEDDQLLLRVFDLRLAGGLRSKSLACGSRDRSTAVSR